MQPVLTTVTKNVIPEHATKEFARDLEFCGHSKECNGFILKNERCLYECVSGRCLHFAIGRTVAVSLKVMNEYASIIIPEISEIFKGDPYYYMVLTGEEIGVVSIEEAFVEKGPLPKANFNLLKEAFKKIDQHEIQKALATNFKYEKRFEEFDCTLQIDLR